MLKTVKRKAHQASQSSFAIVASQYNARYVDAMLRAAKAELKRAGAKKIQIIRVPGAYEIPVVAARLARASSLRRSPGGNHPPPISAILCLAVILRGETSHAALLA